MNLQRIKQLAGILNESVSAVPGIGKSIREGADPASIKMLSAQLSAGKISYEEFKDQLDSLMYTADSMNQGERGHPNREYGSNQRDDFDDFDATEQPDELDEDESDMQTANTAATGQSASQFDASQHGITESADPAQIKKLADQLAAGRITYEEFRDQLDSLEHTAYSMNQGERGNPDARERDIQDYEYADDFDASEEPDEIDEDEEMDESAPPGMESLVMKLKKEYPGDMERVYSTAWSIYNKKHRTEESMDEGFPQHLTPRQIDMMNKQVSDEKWKRYREDSDSLADEYSDDTDADDKEIDESASEFDDETHVAVTQFLSMVKDAYMDPEDAYNKLIQHMDPESIVMFRKALEQEQSDESDEFTEAFDFHNGYDELNSVDGTDYFPDGADSPVVKNTGPSGSRQGDNPQQKKMQVSEVHRELVYGYRDYLKESATMESVQSNDLSIENYYGDFKYNDDMINYNGMVGVEGHIANKRGKMVDVKYYVDLDAVADIVNEETEDPSGWNHRTEEPKYTAGNIVSSGKPNVTYAKVMDEEFLIDGESYDLRDAAKILDIQELSHSELYTDMLASPFDMYAKHLSQNAGD